MKGYAVIATHHKTGTVWMRRLFQRIAKKLALRCVLLSRIAAPAPDELRPPVIVLDDHSEFRHCRWLLDMSDCRLLHLIRDPRDVVISAAHYHRTSKEPWLQWRRGEFAGRSYQEMIENQPDDRARYLFEMDHSASASIGGMRSWDYSRANSLECKYEELIADEDGVSAMIGAFRHLGFDADELAICLAVFRNSTLSSGRVKNKGAHIRSGEARQWRTIYDTYLAEKFIERFGDVLIELGYEADNGWARRLLSPEGETCRERILVAPGR